tara:strand:- start:128 stop:271 length:144 start_codon:yes stop_codon:yes gene_type:complete
MTITVSQEVNVLSLLVTQDVNSIELKPVITVNGGNSNIDGGNASTIF